MIQGKHTDRAVVGSLKKQLLNREVFHGQTWNYRKSGDPFLMNWYCYSNYAGQEDVTELETLRQKERLMVNPRDPDALKFFSVFQEWKSARKKI